MSISGIKTPCHEADRANAMELALGVDQGTTVGVAGCRDHLHDDAPNTNVPQSRASPGSPSSITATFVSEVSEVSDLPFRYSCALTPPALNAPLPVAAKGVGA